MRFGSVGGWLTSKTMLFDYALKTLSFGTTNYVDKLAWLKLVHAELRHRPLSNRSAAEIL